MRSNQKYSSNKERQKAYRDRKKLAVQKPIIPKTVTKTVTKSVTPKKIVKANLTQLTQLQSENKILKSRIEVAESYLAKADNTIENLEALLRDSEELFKENTKDKQISWKRFQEFIKINGKKTGGARSNTLKVCDLPVRHTDVKNWFIIFQTFLELS